MQILLLPVRFDKNFTEWIFFDAVYAQLEIVS